MKFKSLLEIVFRSSCQALWCRRAGIMIPKYWQFVQKKMQKEGCCASAYSRYQSHVSQRSGPCNPQTPGSVRRYKLLKFESILISILSTFLNPPWCIMSHEFLTRFVIQFFTSKFMSNFSFSHSKKIVRIGQALDSCIKLELHLRPACATFRTQLPKEVLKMEFKQPGPPQQISATGE